MRHINFWYRTLLLTQCDTWWNSPISTLNSTLSTLPIRCQPLLERPLSTMSLISLIQRTWFRVSQLTVWWDTSSCCCYCYCCSRWTGGGSRGRRPSADSWWPATWFVAGRSESSNELSRPRRRPSATLQKSF